MVVHINNLMLALLLGKSIYRRIATLSSSEMALQTTLSIEPFDAKSAKWSRWIDRFSIAVSLMTGGDAKKKELLITYMGSEAYDTLCDKLSPEKPLDKSFEEITKTLKDFFEPEKNEILENYRFHLRKQKENETVNEFLVAFRSDVHESKKQN